MSDRGFQYVASLPRPEVRAALRRGDTRLPSLRIFAEDLLGADGSIDLLAVDSEGRVVVLLISDDGKDRDGLTRALAQRAWVRPRLRDWLQLAPSLPVSADAPVVAWLLCPNFSSQTVAAAADLGSDVIELSTLRCVRNGSEATVLVERISPARGALRDEKVNRPNSPETPEPLEHSPRFRSGLSERDLGLTPEEVRDFE